MPEESTLAKAGEFALGFVPFSGVIDVYKGMKSGDKWAVGIGLATIAFDAFTFGGGSLIKGGIKAAFKSLAREGAEVTGKTIALKEASTIILGTAAKKTTERGLWTLTKEGASVIKNHKTFGSLYKSTSDGLWWAVDKAGHGGSKFKVFKETKGGLEWFKDADQFGDFIKNKHKGDVGKFIPWEHLSTVK